MTGRELQLLCYVDSQETLMKQGGPIQYSTCAHLPTHNQIHLLFLNHSWFNHGWQGGNPEMLLLGHGVGFM